MKFANLVVLLIALMKRFALKESKCVVWIRLQPILNLK